LFGIKNPGRWSASHSQAPEKNPYRIAKIMVPSTFTTASVQKMRMEARYTQGTITLKAPKRPTSKLGITRPTALAPFKMAIYMITNYNEVKMMSGSSEREVRWERRY
jgi:hypothetical protein